MEKSSITCFLDGVDTGANQFRAMLTLASGKKHLIAVMYDKIR
jgi:hypothetical protein